MRVVDGTLDATLSAERLLRWMLLPAAALLLSHLAMQWAVFAADVAPKNPLVLLFHLDYERGLGNVYAVAEWAVCLLLAVAIGVFDRAAGRDGAWYWFAFAVVLAGLLVDEQIAAHEYLSLLLVERYEPQGLLYHAWIVPYGLAVLAGALVSRRFLGELPARTRLRLALAAGTFLSGALGVEALQGRHVALHGYDLVHQVVYVPVEESLEMAGLALLAYAFASHLASARGVVRLRFESSR